MAQLRFVLLGLNALSWQRKPSIFRYANADPMEVLRFMLFNRLTNSYLISDHRFLRWNKRLQTMAAEMGFTPSIFIPYLVVFMIPLVLFAVSPIPKHFGVLEFLSLVPFGLLVMALMNKDFFNGQSVVHRRFGYCVVDIKTNQPAGPLKCMLRNVTNPLWPIEAIFVLVNPRRRLGDFIAGTMLVDVTPSDPELILDEIRSAKFDKQTVLTLLCSIFWVVIFMISFDPRMRFW
ncbi:hypothetical protein [Chryseolinea lacunae]|uniref:hypothetical protein n=1 Tax=Chryseolinea lacunae TaxID=2801331 RepID=UPI001F3A1A65|nr:hypothetical protein [Chryseolinea lacunae]